MRGGSRPLFSLLYLYAHQSSTPFVLLAAGLYMSAGQQPVFIYAHDRAPVFSPFFFVLWSFFFSSRPKKNKNKEKREMRGKKEKYQTRCGLMDCRVWKTARIPPVSLLLLFPPSPPSFSYGPERQRYRRGCEQPAERERLEKLGTTGPIKTNATRGNELHSTHTHIAIFITQVMLGLFFFSSRARLNPPPLPGAPPSKLVFFLLFLLFFRKSCHTDGRCWTLMCGLLSLSISRLSLFEPYSSLYPHPV